MSLLALGISFSIAFAVMPAIIWLAGKVGAVDSPNVDVVTHTSPTPLLGGVAIIVGSLGALVLDGESSLPLTAYIWVGALCLMGLYKDVTRRDLSPLVQMSLQTVCCLLILWAVTGPYLPWWEQLLAVFLGVALINGVNFLDVSDGLCAAVAIPILVGLYLVSGYMASLCIAAAILGFMFWNKPKAKVFMGDVGAFFIGAMLYLMLVDGLVEQQLSLAVLLLLTVPYGELGATMLVRLAHARAITQGDASHLSLILLNGGWSPWAVIGLFGGIAMLVAGLVAVVFV